jgi:hypothetical protein
LEEISGFQNGALNSGAIQEGAMGAVLVDESKAVTLPQDYGVTAGDAGVLQDNGLAECASQGDWSGIERDCVRAVLVSVGEGCGNHCERFP